MMKLPTCLFWAIALLALNLTACTVRKQTISTGDKYRNYVAKYSKTAVSHMKTYKIPASIKLAQGLLESAAGQSRLAREANNHFGIKCKPEWTGAVIYMKDDGPNDCFRKYKKVKDSYKDHSLFLSKRVYYTSLFELDIHDYKAWAKGLQKCGYATDPNYANKLIKLIEQYQLYQYDAKVKL